MAIAAATGKDYSGETTVKKNNGTADVTSVLLTPVPVNKDNVKDTVIKDGFYTPAQICTAQYAQACAAAGIS
jgi:D-xylose transport system substrate-binding protein